MPQLTNLNTFPYFDDFDKKSNYHKVLFKPGQPVQARELTTMQSILQNQIEQFGNHVFKDGSVVIPGTLSVRSKQYNIELERTFAGIDVFQYTDALTGVEIVGSESGVRGRVEVVDGNRLFVDILTSGNESEFSEFIVGESITTTDTVNITESNISSFPEGAEIGVIGNVFRGCIAKLTSGVFFLRGYFVEVEDSTVVISSEEPNPTCSIGFLINELLTDSFDDESLYDNSQGFINYAAPGADRLQIEVTLVTSYRGEFDDEFPQNYVEIAKVTNGTISSSKIENPSYNILGDELARRTFDESGHYYVKPFTLDVRESLRDFKGNNGIFNDSELTLFGQIPRDDIGIYDVSPGKAYIFGYEVDMSSNSLLDFSKPRETKQFEDQAITYVTGPTLSLNRSFGAPEVGVSTTYTLSLRDERVGATQTNAPGKEI